MVNQKLNASSAEEYAHKLDENDMAAIQLLDQIKPEAIIRKFSPVKRIRPKDYFDKHFDDKVFQSLIRPYIEKQIQAALSLIHGKDTFLAELKNPIAQKLEWSTEKATVLFHYRRNEDNTHYFATLKHESSRLNIYQASVLLSNKPCFVVVHDRLLQVEDMEGSKIAPFFRKRFISIPRSSEESYFKKFGKKIIENYNVYAVGYKINTVKLNAQPILTLTKLLNGKFGFVLKFRYGQDEFYYHNGQRISVTMQKSEDSFTFNRVKRSMKWESGIAEGLQQIGLNILGNAEFQHRDNHDLEDCIHWLNEFELSFEEKGFELRQELEKSYELAPSTIEFSIEEGIDWFDLKAKVRLGNFDVPFTDIIPYLRRGQLEFPLPNGNFALLPKEWLSKLSPVIELSDDDSGVRLKKFHVGAFNELQSIAPDKKQLEVLREFSGVEEIETPKGFKGELRDYQKAGYDWFYFLQKNNFGGCLADDMGLGKTVQTLALLQNEKETAQSNGATLNGNDKGGQQSLFQTTDDAITNRTSLLIVPTSLTFNWMEEARKFVPDLKILVHSGNQRQKSSTHFAAFDLVITTYGTLRNDIEFLSDYPFHYAILDESQFIKNPESKVAKAVVRIKATHRLSLTGTPIENSVTDLWSQLNYLNQGLLGNLTYFQNNFVNEIEKKGNADKADQLHALIKPFVMRRTKSQVAKELPEKTEKIVYCEMSPEQERLYEATKSEYRNLILEELSNGKGKGNKINLLQGLMKLRQIANHPRFVDEEAEGESGKFEETTMTIPTAISEGHKILVFSSFVKHLSIFVDYAQKRDIPYCYIDGSTTAKQRKKEVESFQTDDDKKLFFISLKAGGFGLNLTEADYVFILDPWWNPASERQAIDRTHRIGQTKNVFTYKFITRGTVEEKILELQNSKKSLSDALIKTEESFVKKLDINDIKALLS